MTSSADRTRRYRQRKASGRVVLPIEIDEAHLPDVLVETGFLAPLKADDPEAVRKAVEQLLDGLVAIDLELKM